MAINKISGNILQDNLQRGANLSFQGNLVYIDVDNTRLGVNTSSTTHTLTVNGNAHISNIVLSGNSISADSGILELGSNANISITGGSANYVLTTDGSGVLSWSDIADVGVIGNLIDLGTPSQGNLTSNAVSLTTTTSVTDGIALLNVVLGKLVPSAPPSFPGGNTLTITTATSSGRMCNFSQTDNTPGANKAVAAGTVVSVIRGSTYSTSTISNTGPGDSGTLTLYLNGAGAGNVTF